MGSYSTEEFLDTFGGLPDRDDPQWLGPDPDRVRDEMRDEVRDAEREARESQPITEPRHA
ncbi:MAG TPA: hypothetical protein VK631_25155 [Solirubrobacteraceae bacterium]|nr:hypothetical protein [Solirubrobacteraceae bacterium]